MARINIEESIWNDPRFVTLIRLCEGKLEVAIGCLVIAWHEAQKFWLTEKKLIPIDYFDLLQGSDKILASKLALKIRKHIYVCGSKEHHDWILNAKEHGKRGGKKTAAKSKLEANDVNN